MIRPSPACISAVMRCATTPLIGDAYGGLGVLINEGLQTFFPTKVYVGAVLSIALALGAGLSGDAILLDPGIDFAKQRDDNLRVYRDCARLHRFGRPILLPVSRKTVIGDVLGLPLPADRDAGTVACIAAGLEAGAQIYRVHNSRAAAQAIRMLAKLTETRE